MHLALAFITLLSVWKWGDWRNWEKYHSTMMYFALGNVLYNFLCANHFLWKLKPDFLPLVCYIQCYVVPYVTAFL
jgi:hypothetical protein